MSDHIEERIKQRAKELGFALVGIARATEADGIGRYFEWLDRGYAGDMRYLHDQAEARRHPDSILDEVRSVVMVGMTYNSELPEVSAGHGRVARYAAGPDYHRYIWDKLNELSDWLEAEVPGCRSHGIADSAPLLERDFARRAGLGWIGKNTMLINKRLGSFVLLGAFLTTLELQPDPPHETRHCGNCTACLDACPTSAFTAPGWLDSRRCISYLTIELRAQVPEHHRSEIGDWLFGCDICQEVCPWNRKPTSPGLPLREDLQSLNAIELLGLDPPTLRKKFKGTSLRRANWRGLLRNAAIVLGNQADRSALPALQKATEWDDAVVREACQWAIQQIESRQSM